MTAKEFIALQFPRDNERETDLDYSHLEMEAAFQSWSKSHAGAVCCAGT